MTGWWRRSTCSNRWEADGRCRNDRKWSGPRNNNEEENKIMLERFNLTAFGAFHTVIALVAVLAGIVALARFGEIGMRTTSGRLFVLFTVVTSVTGLFIFRH